MPAGRSPGRKTATAPHEPRRPAACTPANPGTQVSEPDPAYAARFASPGISRVCAFCCTRQPLDQLAPWATSYACSDVAACDARARDAALYAQDGADERAMAAAEARLGAVR